MSAVWIRCRVAAAILLLSLVTRCGPQITMDTNLPQGDIAHSNKAIVAITSELDTDPSLHRRSGSAMLIFVSRDIFVSGPNGLVGKEFIVSGGTNVYLIDPGRYWLRTVMRSTQNFIFRQNESPVGFVAAAGDVLYLGDMHLVESQPDAEQCTVNVHFAVEDALQSDRSGIDALLVRKYLGAQQLLRTALVTIEPRMFTMKPNRPCRR